MVTGHQASSRMQLELDALRMQQTPRGGQSSGEQFSPAPTSVVPTPPLKKPVATAAKSVAKPSPALENPPAPQTDAAKRARLRRLCERKPSGKLNVPQAIHEKWAQSNSAEKDAMVDALEQSDWDKASFMYYSRSWVASDVGMLRARW